MERIRAWWLLLASAASAMLTIGASVQWALAYNYAPMGCSLRMTAEVVWVNPENHSEGKKLKWGAPGTAAELTRALGSDAQPSSSSWCSQATCPSPTICQVDPVLGGMMEGVQGGEGTGLPSGSGLLTCTCLKTRDVVGEEEANMNTVRLIFPSLPG